MYGPAARCKTDFRERRTGELQRSTLGGVTCRFATRFDDMERLEASIAHFAICRICQTASWKACPHLIGAPPKRAVVQVWDSMEKLQAWRNDPQFKELRQIGGKYATLRCPSQSSARRNSCSPDMEAASVWRPP